MINKYEIMAIIDPKSEMSSYEALLREVFGNGVKSVEKLEGNELAYEINKSKHAHRILALVEAEGSAIAEYTRRTNISKEVWRNLVINLDTEKGINAKPSKFRPKRKANTFTKSPRPLNANNANKEVKAKKPASAEQE
ncbi:30S ribosomal protein S6 [Mycoplasma corogypsi]|uniref:30S ribosomal protein S6 n=1 Tax=Mycoplasma corogypsi TaxID=2106 RepID=UPI00387303B9